MLIKDYATVYLNSIFQTIKNQFQTDKNQFQIVIFTIFFSSMSNQSQSPPTTLVQTMIAGGVGGTLADAFLHGYR
jgi:hypothetical protein